MPSSSRICFTVIKKAQYLLVEVDGIGVVVVVLDGGDDVLSR